MRFLEEEEVTLIDQLLSDALAFVLLLKLVTTKQAIGIPAATRQTPVKGSLGVRMLSLTVSFNISVRRHIVGK